MFFYIILTIQLVFSVAGIYLFDYLPDQIINKPFIIILSILGAFILNVIIVVLYIEIYYLLIGRKLPTYSMRKHKIAKPLTNLAISFANIKVDVIGYENIPEDSRFSIYSNHISFFDIPVQMKVFKDLPVAFVAKKILGEAPLIGKWIEAIGCVLIDRENSRKGAEAIIKSVNQVKQGQPMVIYPEGTRHKHGKCEELLPFKPGAFKLAIKSKRPILPVTLESTKIRYGKKWPKRNIYTVTIHKAIPFEDFKDMKSQEVSDMVKNIIVKPIIKK